MSRLNQVTVRDAPGCVSPHPICSCNNPRAQYSSTTPYIVVSVINNVSKIFIPFGTMENISAVVLAEDLKINDNIYGLDLRRIKIGNIGAVALAEALTVNKTLGWIDLSNTGLSDVGAIALAEMLRTNTTLECIILSNVKRMISPVGTIALMEAMHVNTSLLELKVGGIDLRGESATALATMLSVNTTLELLDLDATKINDEGMIALAGALKTNRSLKILFLTFLFKVYIGGYTALADAIKINTTLTEIHFSECSIEGYVKNEPTHLVDNPLGDEIVCVLADAIQVNSSLKYVDFSGNRIGIKSADALGDMIKANTSIENINFNRTHISIVSKLVAGIDANTTLAKLTFCQCYIDCDEAVAMINAIQKNTTLRELDLSDNDLGDVSAIAMADALIVNSTLIKVDLSSNYISHLGVTALTRAISINTTLQKLKLNNNIPRTYYDPSDDDTVVSVDFSSTLPYLARNNEMAKACLSETYAILSVGQRIPYARDAMFECAVRRLAHGPPAQDADTVRERALKYMRTRH